MPTNSRYPAGTNPYAPSAASKHPASTRGHRPAGSKAPSQHQSQQILPVRKHIVEDAEVEEFEPPRWRTVMHKKVDFGKFRNSTVLSGRADTITTGYPDFYPSRPGFDQREDVLTEENVKNGFAAKLFISEAAETFSMHGPIHQHLTNGCLNMLVQLGKEVIQKQEDTLPQFTDRSFRIPVRVVWNDSKRLAFLSDLANPQIPLHRLMLGQVPHGFKGIELLDAMYSPSTSGGHNRPSAGASQTLSEPIPVERAVWFIRVLGANEITAHRARTHQTAAASVTVFSPVAATPSSTNTINTPPSLPQGSNDWYTQEFTNIIITWLRGQLAQLALPNTGKAPAKPNTNVKSGGGVLQDAKTRARWVSKWDYSNRLLGELDTKQLLSTRLFAGWLSEHLSHVNLAQLGFLLQVISKHLLDISKHQSSARHCLRAACEKLKELRGSPGKDLLGKVDQALVDIIKTLYTADSDVLLSPATWFQHSALLSSIISPSSLQWDDLQRRNQSLMFTPSAAETSSSPRRQQMEEIRKLDSICENTDMVALANSYFDSSSSACHFPLDLPKIEEKVFNLLNWSMGQFQLGAHRPYAVYTLLKHWYDQHENYQNRQSRPQMVDLFDVVYKWMDTSSAAKDEDNVQAIGITVGELTRRGMFSYGRYLQNLIANGYTARHQRPDGSCVSHHLALLRVLPIFVMAKDLLQQRRISLNGDSLDARKQDEEEEERMIEIHREQIKEYVPEAFGLASYGQSDQLKAQVDYHLPSSTQMTRYLYVYSRFLTAHKAGGILKAHDGQPAMSASVFARVTQVFRQSRGYATIADFIIRALQEAEDPQILDVIIDIIHRDADVWTAMDFWPRLGDKLLDKYHMLEREGKDHERLVDLLRELAVKGKLNEEEEDEVKHLPSSNVQKSEAPIADALEALPHVLSTNKDALAVSVVPALFAQNGDFDLWSSTWWATIVDVILRATVDQRSTLNGTLALHVSSVHAQYGHSFDNCVSGWLSGMTPIARLDVFGKKSSEIITRLLLFLVSQRYLSTMVLLEGMVFPIWKQTSAFALPPRKRLSSKMIQAISSSMDVLAQLLVSPPLSPTLPPLSIEESIITQASRQRVLQPPNVISLIQNLPVLVVFSQSRLLPEDMSAKIDDCLKRLGGTAEFKTAAFRNLSVLKDAFLAREWSEPGMEQELEGRMVDALKMIMSENTLQSSPKGSLPEYDSSTRFSAWRWTRVVLEMRVEFKTLAARIKAPETTAKEVQEARQTLNQLVQATLERETNAEDVDLLAEVFKGVDCVVTQEILAAGMDKLASLLGQAIGAETETQLEAAVKVIDQLLRLLQSTTSYLSTSGTPQSLLDPSIHSSRHKLLDLLALALQSVERHFSTDWEQSLPHGISPPQPGTLLKVVVELLKFTLGTMAGDGSAGGMGVVGPNFGHLSVCFFRAVMAGQHILDESSAKSMADILAYIVDCTPPQSRSVSQVSLLGETVSPHIQNTLASFPDLTAALPHLSPVPRSMSLVSLDASAVDNTKDSIHINGDAYDLESAMPLDDRKWEMFDYLGPSRKVCGPQDMYLASNPLRDQSSIPVSLFRPRMTRDAPPDSGEVRGNKDDELPEDGEVPATALPSPVEEDPGKGKPWERFASERNVGDGLSGEVTGARQLATRLFAVVDDISGEGRGEQESGEPLEKKKKVTIGRKEKKGSGSSKDPIAFDDANSEESGSEAPAAKKSKTSKSAASASVAGSDATAPVNGAGGSATLGKAPARKSTGGKTTSKKAAAGKNTKEVTEDKPKAKRRRKSAMD
ncbi:hypothetical protein L198_00420 [Cryptococcus wingfieldii CBS 7118]|uniref:Mediator of RNA polymerase II transcription subunit 12 n=1 Tax=Cryptococcus wingfieldii CBS 7118 TaxID=1295528 RepID=A0A1E3K839_9TREE|nr:hypothetical protein L198_00420 [Cryptococcus wingfieldii CBS 7118]ODO08687.1 hypothetical protein L198_00420 [Cryptococcus wingfieldii CBS 7118]